MEASLACPRRTSCGGGTEKGRKNLAAGLRFPLTDINNYYFAEITCNGYYLVGKKVAGTKSKIQDWTATSNITRGLGYSNVISITRNSANNFSVYINNMGTPVYTFADTSLTDGGYSGFYLVVGTSSDEKFPDTPVDIRFKLTSPFAIP